jgi:hypothetical protein
MNRPAATSAERNGLPYRAAKTVYLLAHGAILPLAIHYLLGRLPETFWRYLFIAGIYVIIPFWIILFIAITMVGFPLRRNEALRVVGVMLLEFAVFIALGGQFLFSVYALFVTSFLGIMLALIGFVFREMTSGRPTSIPDGWRRPALLVGLFLANGLFALALAIPFIQDLGLIPGLAGRIAALGILVFNAISMGRAASREFGPNSVADAEDDAKRERNREWERWAPATAIVLILSLTAAIFVVAMQ